MAAIPGTAADYERRLEQSRLAEHELIGRLERAEQDRDLANDTLDEVRAHLAEWISDGDEAFDAPVLAAVDRVVRALTAAEAALAIIALENNPQGAVAALAMAEGERDHWRMVAERTVADLTEERELRDFYQLQAAPHEDR